MRIISQDKNHDVPYSGTTINISDGRRNDDDIFTIYACGWGDDEFIDLGIYSSYDRALEIMQNLRDQCLQNMYSNPISITNHNTEYFYMPDK